MHRTAWTSSSLPSDRLKPSYPNQQNQRGKAKTSNAPKDLQKSKQVRRLEGLLNSLKTTTTPVKDPKGGCFCQAREHLLSTYTPICRSCGLILCHLNLPHFACPFCAEPLFTPHLKESLVTKLESQITDTLAKEAAERERVIEQARQQAGAFPALSQSTAALNQPITQQSHKVLSLNSKTKKVTVSSYSTPNSSRPASRAASEKDEEEGVVRVPPPPDEVLFARGRLDPGRPYQNLRGGNVKYVAAKENRNTRTEGSGNKSRRKGKGKAGGGNKDGESSQSTPSKS